MVGNKIAGYWHGDSYSCQLLMRHMGKKHNRVTVLVTADRRGDYIERISTGKLSTRKRVS